MQKSWYRGYTFYCLRGFTWGYNKMENNPFLTRIIVYIVGLNVYFLLV
nr:MAG TPA: hypothetical protein [Caudoviricetes sp.]